MKALPDAMKPGERASLGEERYSNGIRSHCGRAGSILEGWARKTALKPVGFALRLGYAIAREDLAEVIEA